MRVLPRRDPNRARLITPVFALVMASTFAYFISVGALIPTLPLFVKDSLDGTDAQVGFAIGTFAISAVLGRPIIGSLGDTRGRKLLVVGGGLAVGISVLAYTRVASLPALLIWRLVTGIGEAGFYVGAASVIQDLAPDERRGEAMSYFSLSLFTGIAIGPYIGESILRGFSFDAAWFFAGGAALLAGIIGIRLPDTRPEGVGQRRPRWFHPAAFLPGAVISSSIWGLATFTSFVPLYALTLGLSGSRYVFLVHSVVVLAMRSVGARLPDALGAERTARYALSFSVVGFGVMGLWQETPGLFMGAGIYSIGHSLTVPALMTMAVKRAPASERGAVIGTVASFFDASFGLAAVVSGRIAETIDYPAAFLSAALAAGIGLTALWIRRGIGLSGAESDRIEGEAPA
jgi:MFS family permease